VADGSLSLGAGVELVVGGLFFDLSSDQVELYLADDFGGGAYQLGLGALYFFFDEGHQLLAEGLGSEPPRLETANEREKLMYRVKLSVDPKLLETYRDYIKAGLTGNAYVRVLPNAAWPAHLAPRLPDVAS